ncbi:alpha/beta fold hydrolase [Flexivirga endophytica]|uniref:alpha/beta fold hydrolase n=1 Tax=Flexivirga endophytica TaxID=1849103 RepID=UPI0016674810|nr:alpha/beta hydrolase [Flexivirga endophytica]
MTTAKLRERYVDLDGVRVHYVTEDGPKDGPRFVLVHGLGGSWANWADVMPSLAERGRVVALDLGGHGLTRTSPEQSTVTANLQLLRRFVLSTCEDRPAVVVGNSMGGLLAAQLAALDKRAVAGAVLIDPAIPPTPVGRPDPMVLVGFGISAMPVVGPRMLAGQGKRVPVEKQVEFTMRLVTSDFDRISPELYKLHLDEALQRPDRVGNTDAQYLSATKSLLWQLFRRGRFAQQMHRIIQPTLLLHGAQDRLVHVRTARALAAAHPHWTYVEGADKGHTPMLDHPEWVADEILRWADSHPAAIARGALSAGA